MWVCTKCNAVVAAPVNGKCPRGHVLYDRFFPTKEMSFLSATLWAFGLCVAFCVLLVWSQRFPWVTDQFGQISEMALLGFGILAVMSFLRGLKWRRQGGAVARLSPRAFGTALGCALAIVAPLIINALRN